MADGFLALMDDNGETREDLKLPDNDLGKEIERRFTNGDQFMVSSCVLKKKKSSKIQINFRSKFIWIFSDILHFI